jgi:hypothetical protein
VVGTITVLGGKVARGIAVLVTNTPAGVVGITIGVEVGNAGAGVTDGNNTGGLVGKITNGVGVGKTGGGLVGNKNAGVLVGKDGNGVGVAFGTTGVNGVIEGMVVRLS